MLKGIKAVAVLTLSLFLLGGCGIFTPTQKAKQSSSSLDAPVSVADKDAGAGGSTSESTDEFAITDLKAASQAGDEITRLTEDKKAHGSPSIFGNYVAWTEAPTANNPEDRNAVIMDLTSKVKYRLGFEKMVFGESTGVITDDFEKVDNFNQVSPLISGNYVAWAEYPNDTSKQTFSSYKYYYSILGKKFEKRALKSSTSFISLDGENNVYFYPADQKPSMMSVAELKTGKIRALPLDFDKYTVTGIVGVNDRKFYFTGLEEPTPVIVDAKGKKTYGGDVAAYLSKDSKLYSMDVDYGAVREVMDMGPYTLNYKGKPALIIRGFAVTDDNFIWAEFNPLKNSISLNSFNFKDKTKKVLVKSIPVSEDPDSDKGTYFGNLNASNDYVTWAVTKSPDSAGNGLFAYSFKTGKTRNILEGSDVNYELNTNSYTMQKQLYGNKLVFLGYQGKYDEVNQYSDVYLAELND